LTKRLHSIRLRTHNIQLFAKSHAGDRGHSLVFGNGENGSKLRAASEVDRLMVGQFRFERSKKLPAQKAGGLYKGEKMAPDSGMDPS
jgi:hypothetical protein